MTLATYLAPRRRLLLLGAATLLLHGVALDWLGSRLGPVTPAPAPGALVTAQLKLALPAQRAPSAPLAEVMPLADARPQAPRPRPRPRPAPAAVAPPAAAPDSVPEPVAERSAAASSDANANANAANAANAADVANAANVAAATGSDGGVAQDGAVAARTAAAPEPVSSSAASVLEEASPNPRRYKVNLPPAADFELAVERIDADGTRWHGVASMAWHTDGSRYTLTVEAGLSLLITRLNLLVLRSEGQIDDYGIAPEHATEQRRGRAETATHFNRDERSISFSASPRRYPLLVGAQDKATLPFQLGAIGRANPDQFSTDIDLQVGEEREATLFRFQLVGAETLETRLGPLPTWHLTRPPKPGSYGSRLDIWLAPTQHWYPVQIRNTEASGALTTQTVTRITPVAQ